MWVQGLVSALGLGLGIEQKTCDTIGLLQLGQEIVFGDNDQPSHPFWAVAVLCVYEWG